jgi:hypothetical protein
MTFNYLARERLPRLAWLAKVNLATGECSVDHRRLVETRAQFFVKGVWAGHSKGRHPIAVSRFWLRRSAADYR